MADRPRYTHTQLSQFFNRIGLPEGQRVFSVAALADSEKLEYLTVLVKHALVRIPFENLTQHYSWHRTVNVRLQHLFRKIVLPAAEGDIGGRTGEEDEGKPARGGYCMENNSLMHTVLLSLGFTVFMAGARVYKNGRYGGFSHCVNIAIIKGERYMLDIGFGANGPTSPLRLVPGAERQHVKDAPARVRLIRGPIPQQVYQGCQVWIYQHCIDPTVTGTRTEQEWMPLYCFVDFEFLLEDIHGMNLSPWRSPTSFFTYRVMLARFTTDLEVNTNANIEGRNGEGEREGGGPGQASEKAVSEGNIDGVLLLFHDTLKWRRGGETRLEIRFENEDQRVEALRRYFGIVLDKEDREAIRGTAGEIK
ncbi:hypothetical protein AAE478_009934 [Parahypoxylon ruwenzoriense]